MKPSELLEVPDGQLTEVGQRLEQRRLVEADYVFLKVMLDTIQYARRLLEKTAVGRQRLLRMLFGARTEKTSQVLHPDAPAPQKDTPQGEAARPKRKGHGRLGADAYTGAHTAHVSHPSLMVGAACPQQCGGPLYDTQRPARLLRLVAHPPVAATLFAQQTLRCSLCGKTFTAPPPAEAGNEKCDPNVAPTLALMRYGYGLPLNRLAQLQADVGVPLPVGTQWELIADYVQELWAIYQELLRQAADGEVFFNDDTPIKILSLLKENREAQQAEPPDPKRRTGIFTTGIVVKKGALTLMLFFSGRRHAGENLQALLDQRNPALPTPIQMSDGLSRNVPARTETQQGNCNAHGRRGFVEVSQKFPEDCAHVLETIQQVYAYDGQAKAEGLSPEQRLELHQQYSGPLLAALRQWMEQKLAAKEVEPNSSLGEAIEYVLKHWEPLTLFLRVPGAPLDNNICERALKMAIRHRNNSLFYKTENGAHIGDLFMSLIHTCRLNRVNPLDYLNTLRRYAHRLRDGPAEWMPWNYMKTVAALAKA